MTSATQPITVLISALGGQGGGVLAEWLVDVAREAGYAAQSTSIPGVAQRTGATTYYVEVHPVPVAALGGRAPVLSLLPVPGGIDLFVASELMEAARSVQTGMASAERTFVVASTSRTLTTTEKMAQGDGRFASDRLQDVLRRHSRRLAAFDMEGAARDAGTVVSAVMFGAIAGSGVLPFARDAYEAAIRASGLGVDASLAGFALGWAAVQAEDRPPAAAATEPPAVAPSSPATAAFPAAARDIVDIGYARQIDYQDVAYADLYLRRLDRILAAERAVDPAASHGHALTRETARFLALWMAFDDIVRVADLKCRASRYVRVRREVAATDGDVVRIVDYFKPGAAEFAALLPAALARRVVAWDRRRQLCGKGPFALALHVRADGMFGHATLRTLASLRWLRRRGSRYAAEQAAIERWLAAIEAAARDDWTCAHELALCGRLIKGYGATNDRGKDNLAHIVDHLAAGGAFAGAVERAAAIRDAREAALADEGGVALDRMLAQHQVPPRAVRPQPIVWTKRRPAPSAPSGRG
ncbi:MAG: indolepyruvate oxidoreductase subunit beta family protein [Betaproteobacteria bacterium]